jgi:hypothetical protein
MKRLVFWEIIESNCMKTIVSDDMNKLKKKLKNEQSNIKIVERGKLIPLTQRT